MSETSISLFEAFYGTITPFKEEVEINPLLQEEEEVPATNITTAYLPPKKKVIGEEADSALDFIVENHPKIGRVPRLFVIASMAVFGFAVLYLIYALCLVGDLSSSVTTL